MHETFLIREHSVIQISFKTTTSVQRKRSGAQAPAGLGRGLVDRGRGFDKGAIRGAKGVSELQKWPSGASDFN